MKTFAAASAFCLLTFTFASAQEIVVTGSRIAISKVPQISIARHADFLLRDLRVECDTRDKAQRLAEIRSTLKAALDMTRSDKTIALGVYGTTDEDSNLVRPFTENNYGANILESNGRSDVSSTTLIVKTPILPNETVETAAMARIERFVHSVKLAGRTTLTLADGFSLSVVDPEQYRAPLLKLIAANAKQTADVFGPGYGPEIWRLQNPVEWSRTGPIDLALYIDYQLNVQSPPR